jgi:hypothetical protein
MRTSRIGRLVPHHLQTKGAGHLGARKSVAATAQVVRMPALQTEPLGDWTSNGAELGAVLMRMAFVLDVELLRPAGW